MDWQDVRGAIMTIDAMGCQKAIAEKIIDKGEDYLLALKGNQSGLHDDVLLHFEQPSATTKLLLKVMGESKSGNAG